MNIKKRSDKVLLVMLIIMFVVMAFLLGIFRIESPEIKISEVCISNNGIIHDSMGFYNDYVEIYNATDETVNLTNFYLSDNKDNLYKYKLEYVTIDPYEYELVYLSDSISGFSLSFEETLYLTSGKGVVEDSLELNTIDEGYVYCFDFENEEWLISDVPTPGALNVFDSGYRENIAAPVVSHASGFYTTSFYLELSGSEEIYYTLDGSTPTKESLRYVEPINIYNRSSEENKVGNTDDMTVLDDVSLNEDPTIKGMVLRAVSYNGDNYGKETIETYFIGIEEEKGYNELPTVSLVMDPANLFDYENGIYVKGVVYDVYKDLDIDSSRGRAMTNYSMNGKGWSRKASILSFNERGSLDNSYNIDFDIHGNYSRDYLQKSFNIQSVDGEIMNIAGIQGEKLVLKATVSNNDYESDSPKFRDYIEQKLMNSSNVSKQDGCFIQLFINGEYWGVYEIMNRVSIEMISEKYGIDTNIICINKYGADGLKEFGAIDLESIEECIEYIETLDLTLDDNYEYVKSVIDIDSLIYYYAYELYLNNYDWITNENNYALWKTAQPIDNDIKDGKWRFIIFDLDCTANIKYRSYDYNPFIDEDDNIRNIKLFTKLLENDSFVNQFVLQFKEIMNNDLSYARVKSTLESYYKIYSSSFIESQKRFSNSEYDYECFMKEIDDYLTYFKERPEYAREYLDELLEVIERNVK